MAPATAGRPRWHQVPAPVHLLAWPVSVGPCTAPGTDPTPERPRSVGVRPPPPRTLVTGPGRPRPGGPGDYASSDTSTNRGLRNHGTGPEQEPQRGNKPKPGTTSGGTGGQSAKDRSRAQSRPVSGKAPSGRSGKVQRQQQGRGQQAQAEAGGPAAGHPRPAQGLRGHDGLGSGGAGGRDHRGAGRREGQQRLEQQHRLHAGHRGAGLGGARRDQHPRVRLQHRRDQLAVGAGDSPHHPVQPAPDDPRRQVTGHALLRRRVLPVLRRRTVGH